MARLDGRGRRRKGRRREIEFAELIGGETVIRSGAEKHRGEQYTGDVVGLGKRWEVKSRGKDSWKELYAWLSEKGIDGLAIKADYKEWLVILPAKTYMEDIRKQKKEEIERLYQEFFGPGSDSSKQE